MNKLKWIHKKERKRYEAHGGWLMFVIYPDMSCAKWKLYKNDCLVGLFGSVKKAKQVAQLIEEG